MNRVRKVIGNAIVLSAIIIAVFTPLALVLTRPMLQLMGTPENIMDDAALYISIVFGGYACTMLYNVMASLLRAFGDTRTPLFFLILSSVINIVLDISFVVLFHWGVAGVAVATLIAQFHLRQPLRGLCRPQIRGLPPQTGGSEAGRKNHQGYAPAGIPMALQSSLTAVGMVVMQASINDFGSNVVASYTAAHKVEALVGMLAMTLGTTTATFVGQNFGAKNYDRMFKGIRINVTLATIYAVASALICFLVGRRILMIFVDASTPGAEEILDVRHDVSQDLCRVPLAVQRPDGVPQRTAGYGPQHLHNGRRHDGVHHAHRCLLDAAGGSGLSGLLPGRPCGLDWRDDPPADRVLLREEKTAQKCVNI